MDGSFREAMKLVRTLNTRGGLYHMSLEIKFEREERITGVLQCQVINDGVKLRVKHWNKNKESMLRDGTQHYRRIQDSWSYQDSALKRGVLSGCFLTMDRNS